jgi:aryl-alcohol dehydrogenase-like predicted oxidoreductase
MAQPKRSERMTLTRRRAVQLLAMLLVGGRTLWRSGDARAAVAAAKDAAAGPSGWPAMTYRTLGRTGFEGSRLVMGCGASLMFKRKDELLHAAREAGINVFDVGYRGYYRWAERNLAPFLKEVRDDVFLISKAPADPDVEPESVVTPSQAKQAAETWSERLDRSLQDLGVDRVDAYYVMAAYNPSFIESDEIRRAFEAAKQAGKVKHLGVSTHRNAEQVLRAAVATGAYDLAMVAITPGGWYDWDSKSVLAGSKPMKDLQPVLEEAKASGIGLVGMKAARHISGLPLLGWWKKLDAFDPYYDDVLMAAPLSPFQRSYAYVLGHGLDVVNADIQDVAQLQENVAATAASRSFYA